MKIKPIKNTLFYLIAVTFSVFLLFFVITCSWIGYEVQYQCQEAQRKHPGDCVESLLMVLKDDTQSFRTRNSAIWALGQLGDRRALSVLQGYYTGQIPPREPLDQTLSQYELKKAINLTSGAFNISAIVWRGLSSK